VTRRRKHCAFSRLNFALFDPFERRRPSRCFHHRRDSGVFAGARSIRSDKAVVAELLKPAPADEMTACPVTARVNDVKNDGPELIEPAHYP
jgi:hypothetical protein